MTAPKHLTILRPLLAAAAIGIATIAPAKANNETAFAPFSYAVNLNLTDVQADLEDELNAIRQQEECGTSFNLSDARVTPVPNSRAIRVTFRARVSDTQCTYTRRAAADRDGSRSRSRSRDDLISEATTTSHVNFTIEVSPKVNGNNIGLETKVATADANGTFGRLKLDAKIKDIVLGRLYDAVDERIKPTMPSGLIRSNARLGEVGFIDIGGGKLGLTYKTNGQVRVQG